MTRPRLLVAEPQSFSPRAADLLAASVDVELRACTAEELRDAFQTYDAVWIRLGLRIDAETVGASPTCRFLAVPATGLDHIDLEHCRRAGVEVLSLRGENAFLSDIRATAEHTIALMLACMRHLPAAADAARAEVWARDEFRGTELYRRSVGIVGMGRLGRIVARYLDAFGSQVSGYDPRPDFPDGPTRRCDTLDSLLGDVDLVTLHVRYDHETHHLIGEGELSRMRPGSMLVNTSRGGVVDDKALLASLESGHLGAAALDVLDGEPDVKDHPLLAYAREHDNLLITPHIGGNTEESGERTDVFVAEKLLDRLAGTTE